MLPYAEGYQEEFEKEKKVAWYHTFLLNHQLKVISITLLLAVALPILVYRYVFYDSLDFPPSDGFSMGSCLLPRESRIPCGKGSIPSNECHSHCCYDHTNNYCFHRLPSRFSYLLEKNTGWEEEDVFISRIATVPFGFRDSIRNIKLSIDEVSPTHLTLTFYDPQAKSLKGTRIEDKNYEYRISIPELNIQVESNGRVIFTTARGPIIAAKDIWEITFQITNETMFGLGEIPLGETPKVIYNNKHGLQSIPLIYAVSNGSYHGILIDSGSPTEIFKVENQIIVRALTTVGLKFHLFVGPAPKDVMRDVRSLIGLKKPEYWMLGAHICSEIAGTPQEKFENLTSFLREASIEGLPFDSHCGTMPIVFDSSCDNDTLFMDEGAALIQDNGKRFVPLVSPYIRYKEEILDSKENESLENLLSNRNDKCFNILINYEDYLLKDPISLKMYKGRIENYTVVYPDYKSVPLKFMELLGVHGRSLDGAILENNWPLEESAKDIDYAHMVLPYFNEHLETAFDNTPQWNTILPNNSTYIYHHNEYGNNFIKAFSKALDDIPLWSSSQYLNGEVGINSQKIEASWNNLRKELINAALGGISGHLNWISPVCGDTENFDNITQAHLCVNWYSAAIFLPMLKIHSKGIPRHPLAFGGTNKKHIINALKQRQSLLPYFYTTLQDGPLLRPMFFQYPHSEVLRNLTTQFNVGEDLLIVPTLLPNQINVHVTIPPGFWYELWSGLPIRGEEGDVITMAITEGEIPTMIRGGAILVLQKDVRTTAEETRLNSNFSIIIALHCLNERGNPINNVIAPVMNCESEGTLYINANTTLNFEVSENRDIVIRASNDDLSQICGDNAIWAHVIKELSIYGLDAEYNNYDHSRHITVDIDLCYLINNKEIVFSFI